MENKNFSDIGKIEAIRLLFEESHFKQADGTSYLCGEKGSVVRTASRIWLEGIDFDLTYFPLNISDTSASSVLSVNFTLHLPDRRRFP